MRPGTRPAQGKPPCGRRAPSSPPNQPGHALCGRLTAQVRAGSIALSLGGAAGTRGGR